MPTRTKILLLVALLAGLGGAVYKFVLSPDPAAVVPDPVPAVQQPGEPGGPGGQPGAGDPAGGPGAGGPGSGQGGTGTPGAGTGSPGAGTGAPGAGGAGAGEAPDGSLQGAAGAAGRIDPDSTLLGSGLDAGNTAYAVKVAGIVSGVAKNNGLNFSVDVHLTPAEAGLAQGASDAYKRQVRGAVMRIQIVDQQTLSQWNSNPVGVRKSAVTSWLKLLKRVFPNAYRSVTVVSPQLTPLAVGDGGPKGKDTATVF